MKKSLNNIENKKSILHYNIKKNKVNIDSYYYIKNQDLLLSEEKNILKHAIAYNRNCHAMHEKNKNLLELNKLDVKFTELTLKQQNLASIYNNKCLNKTGFSYQELLEKVEIIDHNTLHLIDFSNRVNKLNLVECFYWNIHFNHYKKFGYNLSCNTLQYIDLFLY
jgi:hypothetical protein